MRHCILLCSGPEAATWKSSTDEDFGGVLGHYKKKCSVFSRPAPDFPHLPSTLQEDCPNSCSVAGLGTQMVGVDGKT